MICGDRLVSNAILQLTTSVGFEFDAVFTNAELDTFWLLLLLVRVDAEASNSGYERADDEIEEITTFHWDSPFHSGNETRLPEVPAENNFFAWLVFPGLRPRIPYLVLKVEFEGSMAKFSKSRWEKITAVEAILCAAHPKAFVPFLGNAEQVYPLKIGIDKDIVAFHPDIDVKVLASFMKHYVTLPRYLKITGRAGMPRVDLNGDVSEVISEFEARNARKFLEVVQARRPAKRSRPAPSKEESCSFTGKVRYASAFQADQAMIRTRQRSGDNTAFSASSFKCRCGFYHWGRS